MQRSGSVLQANSSISHPTLSQFTTCPTPPSIRLFFPNKIPCKGAAKAMYLNQIVTVGTYGRWCFWSWRINPVFRSGLMMLSVSRSCVGCERYAQRALAAPCVTSASGKKRKDVFKIAWHKAGTICLKCVIVCLLLCCWSNLLQFCFIYACNVICIRYFK